MNKCLFIKNGIITPITAESIPSRKEYLEKYRGYLFCPHPGCTAHLSFAETPHFNVKKIFKTTKNSVHSEDCPYKIIHAPNKGHKYSSETINQALSDKHKRDILKKLFYRNQEIAPSSAKGSVSISKPQKDPTDSDIIAVAKPIASIYPDALPAPKGAREPVVKKRRCSDILPEDVGKLLALDDYAVSATIANDYVEIKLSSGTTLLFYNAFRDSSPAAYSLLQQLAVEINSARSDLLICFIGIVEKKEHGYQVQIMDPSLITFNDCSIFNYKTVA